MKYDKKIKEELIAYLSQYVTEKRLKKFSEVLNERTAHITVVLEDIYQGHNAAAVLRSCDCFGIQHVHFIENRNNVKISDDVAMGSSNWLSIHRHKGTDEGVRTVIKDLKQKGYKVVATTPHEKNRELSQLDVKQPLALVFGTEINGISQAVVEEADELVKIPMYGFTESFNISVSAALCLYELSTKMRREVENYRLSEEEQTELYLQWLVKSIDAGELLVKDWEKKR